MTERKQWCVVEFVDGVQLVPYIWIIDEQSYWPVFKSNLRYEKAVKNYEPPLDTWSLFPIKRILGIFENYDRAKHKLKLAEEQSDLNTDLEDEAKQKRKFKKKVIFSSSYEKEEEASAPTLKPYPQPVFPKKQANQVKRSTEDTPTSSVSAIRMTTINTTSYTGCIHAHSLEEGVMQNVMKEINFIKVNIIKMQQTLKPLVKKDSGILTPTSVEFTMEDYPLRTMDALMCAEKKLVDDTTYYNNLKTKLGLIGGYKLDEIVKLILRRLFDDQLAAEFSWLGAKKKKIFSNLKHADVVFAATRANPKAANATDQEIVDCIKNWLRHASARSKNRLTSTAAEDDTWIKDN
ncbi:unnamed protein product, partial [Callosobruchus maculatus]